MLGEITMVQLYSVALTAGKAHKDHKHHHAHHYEHDTTNNTPRPITRQPVTGPPLPPSPFLTGGQINPQVRYDRCNDEIIHNTRLILLTRDVIRLGENQSWRTIANYSKRGDHASSSITTTKRATTTTLSTSQSRKSFNDDPICFAVINIVSNFATRFRNIWKSFK